MCFALEERKTLENTFELGVALAVLVTLFGIRMTLFTDNPYEIGFSIYHKALPYIFLDSAAIVSPFATVCLV
jgi:hypothetical protein